jgi:hypothetical protein
MSDRFQRYVDALSDDDALALHRIVCRRAAAIYGPMHAAKREANYRASVPRARVARQAARA